MRERRGWVRGLTAVLAWLACAVPETLWALDAAELQQKTGLAGGLCSFPRAGEADAKLAFELAARPTFVVHLQSPDARLVAAWRDQAEAQGLLGRTLYVEQGEAAPLPFADRLVDLLVAGDVREADLSPEQRAAWLRVLAPGRGVAFLAGGKTLKAALPPGSDSWTHRCHGADNTQVSGDTTFKPPFLAQWWAMPRQEGFWGTTVVSGNGRLFTIRGSRNSREQVFLTARSLGNGLVLWQKLLRQSSEEAPKVPVPHGGYIPGRSCVVVAGDALYLVERDSILRLNAETGAERDRLAGPKPGGQVKWVAFADGALAVLAGDADVIVPIAYQTVAANPVGRDLAVYDAGSKKELWRDTLPGDLDERAIAVRDRQIFYLAQGAGVVCRELRTGKEVWKNPDAEIQAEYRTPDQKAIGQMLVSQPALMVLDDVVLLRARWAKNIVALSRADGTVLWKKPVSGGRTITGLAVDGLWLGGGRDGTIDLKTGQTAPGPKLIGSGCGPTTAVPGYLITCFGSVAEMKSGKVLHPADLKSPCDVGSLVSEGVMVTVPSECSCGFEVKCYRAMAAAGELKPHEAPPWKERLTETSAAAPATMALTAADWPTYRHDPQRSGASAATVGDAAKVLWQWKPNGAVPYKDTWNQASGPRLTPDYLATAPVTGGEKVYFASHDGVVRCLQADSGKEVWKFATGAMLFASPTLWEGRVLAGGGDGRVYCLDATTGKLLWRLLAAPGDRRIFWQGHLVNTWPVTGGVVVKDGVGYVVAGYQADSGIHVYAFEPRTGQVIWEKHDAGAGKSNPGQAMSSGGGVAIADDKLCLAGWSSGTFDLKTGDWKTSGGAGFGGEVGMLCDRWVLRGGRRLTESESAVGSPINGGFQMGVPGVTSLPAWDANLVLFAPGGASGSLLAVPTDKYVAWKTENKLPTPPAQPVPVVGSQTNAAPLPKPKPPALGDFMIWASTPGLPASFALAKDMAVVAFVDAKNGHKLVAFRRADGAKAWSVDLPDQPAMNRLAVDRDGRILVALCDSSILCAGR